MAPNLKMIYFPESQNNWELREKSIHLHIGLNLTEGSKVFHKFLKSCLAKHISRHREWDEVVPLATASYNWLPNQHSKESPFFVMFGRDAVTNLSQLTKPKLRYMGTEDLILDLELMSSIFQTQIHNLRMAQERVIEGQQPVKKRNIEVGDLVLVRDHTSKCFMPKYKVDFRVVRVQGNRAEVKDK